METASQTPKLPERQLLEAARDGDENAFRLLVEPRRSELQAHCYRMLGSLHDAEDALQDALLRAWRGLGGLHDRASLRAWLYRIATNTCLDLIARRPKRVLPVDYCPPTDPQDGPGKPVTESVWIEPYPDETLEVEDGYAAPQARFEQREAVELAFISALQNLPPNQRAVLILREVLGFSAKEVASSLETTVASVNSALQRARKAVDERLPEQSQQATRRSLGNDRIGELVDSYVDAWQRNDVDAVVAMLAEDASFTMPPLASWFGGSSEALAEFLRLGPLTGEWRWRPLRARASGQEALAFYCWYPDEEAYLPFALNVLTFRGERISDVTAFVTRSIEIKGPDTFARWPEQPPEASRLEAYFERFRLPPRVTDATG